MVMTAVPSDPAKTALVRDFNRDWKNAEKPRNKQSCNDFTVTDSAENLFFPADSKLVLTTNMLVAEEGLEPPTHGL